MSFCRIMINLCFNYANDGAICQGLQYASLTPSSVATHAGAPIRERVFRQHMCASLAEKLAQIEMGGSLVVGSLEHLIEDARAERIHARVAHCALATLLIVEAVRRAGRHRNDFFIIGSDLARVYYCHYKEYIHVDNEKYSLR